MLDKKYSLGIYEKALPKDVSWEEKLIIAKNTGFDFVEISIDETDARLARLDWDDVACQKLVADMHKHNIFIRSMCLSGHRRFPFGSKDENIRAQAYLIMGKAIKLATKLGIRTIQLAGYDVYYEPHDLTTVDFFQQGLKYATDLAAKHHVMLAIETMDTPFFPSIKAYKYWQTIINSPWLKVYPDIGNLSAWQLDLDAEIASGFADIVGFHLKDTLMVTGTTTGKFKEVPFGDGCVDFVHVFKLLQKYNYQGSLLIEMWSENAADPIAEVIKAKQWIEDQMQKGGYQY